MHVNGTITDIPEGICQCGCGAPTGFAEQNDARRGVKKGDRLKFAATGHNKRIYVSRDGLYLCRMCRDVFPEGAIVRDIKKGKRSDVGYCHDCQKKRYLSHKERFPVQRKMATIQARLRRSYGITIDDYVEMYEARLGCCDICGTKKKSCLELNTTSADVLHVDHCHTTGRIRGLLCINCNHGIGRFRDDPDTLRAAIEYLAFSNS